MLGFASDQISEPGACTKGFLELKREYSLTVRKGSMHSGLRKVCDDVRGCKVSDYRGRQVW
jgi:hypothetical protein